ncbi:MAG: hypothetical protein OEW18_13485 [Candidatus Aminicenantes bacterium]|nr:hypothetical protein [Candidatus Aminicenantes bacterium]
MRITLKVVFVSALCLAFAVTAMAQEMVNFKKLQEFLPKIELSGYTKGKPGGETTKAFGMAASEATLRYKKSEESGIEVKISDTAGVPMAAMGLAMVGMTEYENETENGYEKTIKVLGFPGTEKVDRGEYKSAEISIVVAKRFMVELNCEGCDDIANLKKLVESMDLGGLAKLAN